MQDECSAQAVSTVPLTLILIHNEIIVWDIQYHTAPKLANLSVVVSMVSPYHIISIEVILKFVGKDSFHINFTSPSVVKG